VKGRKFEEFEEFEMFEEFALRLSPFFKGRYTKDRGVQSHAKLLQISGRVILADLNSCSKCNLSLSPS